MWSLIKIYISLVLNLLFRKCLFAFRFSGNWFLLLFVGCPFQIAWETKRRRLLSGAVCVVIFLVASIYFDNIVTIFTVIFELYLWSSKRSTYDDVVEKVAQQLCLDDPSKIRLTQHNPSCQQPKPHHIKYRSVNYLWDMLHFHNQVWTHFLEFWLYSLQIIWTSIDLADVWHIILWHPGYSVAWTRIYEVTEDHFSKCCKPWG